MDTLFTETPLIRSASRELVRELGLLENAKDSLPTTWCHALIELERFGVMTIADLAEKLHLDKSTMSRTLSKLEKKGWVEQRKNESDRRQRPMALTDEGRNHVAGIHTRVNDRVQRALAKLPPEERQIVLKGLDLYVKGLSLSRLDFPRIRAIQPEDDVELAVIIRSGMAEFGLTGPGTGYDHAEIDFLSETYHHEGCSFLVVADQARLAGGGGISPITEISGACELKRMYLRTEYRGRGLGSRLLKDCLERAAEMGYRECYLETMSTMEQARKLYRSYGFEETSRYNNYTSACNTMYVKPLRQASETT